MKNNTYEDNRFIEMVVDEIYRTNDQEAYIQLLMVLERRMRDEGEAPMPMVVVNGNFPFPDIPETENIEEVMESLVGKTFTLEEDVRFRMDTMMDSEEKQWIPLFTSDEEKDKQPTTEISMNVAIERILKAGLGDDVEGVVINPFGKSLQIPKTILEILSKNNTEEGDN